MSRERAENDFYVEPEWAVEALINSVRFDGVIWDPACGTGTIPNVFRRHGTEVWASDIVNRWCEYSFICDFLSANVSVPNIVSNPPYNLAQRFVERALSLADKKVAMLLRLAFLEGRKRKKFFETTPLSRVLVFAPRVSMPPGGRGIRAAGGMVAFAWFVWDHEHRGPPTIGWLDRP